MLYPAPPAKLIEEAPSWALSDALRREMGEKAVAAAKEAGYVGRGYGGICACTGRSLLFYGNEHPNPGGAPGDGDGNRC